MGKNTKDDPQPTTSADTFDTTRADPDRMPDQVYGPTSSVVQQPVMQQPLAQPQLPTKQQPPAWLVGLVAMLACIVVALAVVILTDSNAETPQDDSAQTQQESTDEAEDAEPEPDQEPEPKADPPVFTEATCSSEIPPDGYSDSYSSYNVLSDDTQHAWNAESSEGEWIQVAAVSKQTVEGFSIMPGYIKREDVYYKNSRPKEIEIELSDGYTQTVSLKDNYRKEQ